MKYFISALVCIPRQNLEACSEMRSARGTEYLRYGRRYLTRTRLWGAECSGSSNLAGKVQGQ